MSSNHSLQELATFEVVAAAVTLLREVDKSEKNDEVANDILRECAHRDGAVDVAEQLLCSDDVVRRHVGIRLAGYVADINELMRERIERMLQPLLAESGLPSALRIDAVTAIGNTRLPAALPSLLQLIEHVDEDMRLQAVNSITSCLADVEPEIVHQSKALHALLDRMEDLSPPVRDWASFSVGQQLDLDSATIRNALAKRLFDDDEPTRLEAIRGLARRRDKRAFDAVVAALESDNPTKEIFEAAHYFADPQLYDLLMKHDAWSDDASAALDACDPHARTLEDESLTLFIEELAEHPDAQYVAVMCPLFELGVVLDDLEHNSRIDLRNLLQTVNGDASVAVTKVFELL